MSTEAENRTEPVNAAWSNAAPASGEPAAEAVKPARVDGARVNGERVDGVRVEAERIDRARAGGEGGAGGRADGARIDGERVDDGRVDAGRVDDGRVDTERIDDGRVDDGRVDDERGDAELIDGARVKPPLLEITVTADEAFARALRRNEVRQGRRSLGLTALIATLLIATSLGATVAEAPWWTAFGMLGLAGGFIVWVVVIGSLFQRHEAPPGLLDPTRYVFGLEALEWSTDSTTTRLNWSAVGNVRSLPYGYQINRKDGGTAVVICRTTLTAEQDARLRSYFSGLAAMSTTTGA